ncbi:MULTISPECIES: MFS transporter [unclassified Solwaraspora]|uniref:MFS transporter n=1 Tax=unclassified Solwaraspora TaxID=2627926 RepID=UPI00248B034A|nr:MULTISPECIES: MFS transporter [unclassified Solwaraspora]WBB98646.1 MFS transporter [Solwaraspora sp. WMMA2059]WBC22802.1 MFS transporter [Solwaraspora sp. WMMA2080]WJK35157.1 MFS transporter [Solwaraspora sp. WMMA2065]
MTALTAPSSVTDPPPSGDVTRIQRRTLRLLAGTQMIGGVGVTIGISVGGLLAAELGGVAVSGLAQSAAVVGGALLAVPVVRIMNGHGRRPGLVFAYLTGATGAVLVVAAAAGRWVPLLFVGMVLFGGATTAGLQARYAAVDLTEPRRRGRQLSLVVWATTVGAVTAPNLAGLADRSASGVGLPPLAGPFAVSTLAFLLAALLVLVLLRPDPLLTARRIAGPAAATAPVQSGRASQARSGRGLRAAFVVVAARPAARLGVCAVAVGHLVMVGVMAMTPVHIGMGHTGGDLLRTVGLVLSLHIAGMYALSPVVGWLTDRAGRRPVIVGGVGLLLAACAVAGTAGHDPVRLVIGLVLLGLGWSGTMVAGSTLLSESVPVDVRPSVQGLSDLVMGLAGAFAGGVSGIIVGLSGYGVLTLLSALATVPLLGLVLRPVPAPSKQ